MPRTSQETWTGPAETAQERMAEPAVAPWTAWTLVSETAAGTTLRRTRPLTLPEELQEDARRNLLKFATDMVGGLPWPADIDEWRDRYDPLAAVDERLRRAGHDPDQIPLVARQALAQIMDMIFQGVVFFHGQAPGLLY